MAAGVIETAPVARLRPRSRMARRVRPDRGRGRSAGGRRSEGRTRAGSWSRDRAARRCTCSRTRACRGLSPEGWANRVAAAAARWNTAIVVAEANNGGAMVGSVLKAADFGLKVRLVHASKGKCAQGRADRAEVRDAARRFSRASFPELEDELAGYAGRRRL